MRGRWSSKYKDYQRYLFILKAKAVRAGLNPHDLEEGRVGIIFGIAMPRSWSKKKRALHLDAPHQTRPDISNLLKAVEDALLEEDSKIWRYPLLEKRWSEEGKIVFSLYEHLGASEQDGLIERRVG